MIDVNWNDNAKEAVREFADYIGQSDKGERYLEHIAPNKTVADAVEYYNGELPEGEDILGIAYSNNKIVPYYAGSPIADGTNSPESYIICTRAEFEAYVKEQESEKWTHIYGSERCKVLIDEPDTYGSVVILLESGRYSAFCGKHELKPIKKKLTKSQAWDLCQDYEGSQGMVKYMLDLHDEYDII